jgi:hypothetical protein
MKAELMYDAVLYFCDNKKNQLFTSENILNINFITYPDTKYYSGKQTKADKMVGAYGTYGGK